MNGNEIFMPDQKLDNLLNLANGCYATGAGEVGKSECRI